jgi:hypothetical protein
MNLKEPKVQRAEDYKRVPLEGVLKGMLRAEGESRLGTAKARMIPSGDK